jgi:hypothetical protein
MGQAHHCGGGEGGGGGGVVGKIFHMVHKLSPIV